MRKSPERFRFFQAVRVLEAWLRSTDANRNPVGGDYAPDSETIRFKATSGVRFAATEIDSIRPPDDADSPWELLVSFLGLTGPAGVLPHHYSELIVRRLRQKDSSLADFLDLFNHRLISHFYRSWEKTHVPSQFENAQLRPTSPSPLYHVLYSLVGIGTPGLRNRQHIHDNALLYFGGTSGRQVPTAVGLQRMLAETFGLPVQVVPLFGQWLKLSENERSCLGRPAADAAGNRVTALAGKRRVGQHNSLGQDFVLGARVWDLTSKFRLVFGPIDYPRFRQFLPTGPLLRAASELTRTYVGMEFDFDVQLVLKGPEVPPCRLSSKTKQPSHLGWNCWLRSRPPDVPADNSTFRAMA